MEWRMMIAQEKSRAQVGCIFVFRGLGKKTGNRSAAIAAFLLACVLVPRHSSSLREMSRRTKNHDQSIKWTVGSQKKADI